MTFVQAWMNAGYCPCRFVNQTTCLEGDRHRERSMIGCLHSIDGGPDGERAQLQELTGSGQHQQVGAFEQCIAKQVDERDHECAGAHHPRGQRRAREVHADAPQLLVLAIQRQGIGVLHGGDVGEQSGAGLGRAPRTQDTFGNLDGPRQRAAARQCPEESCAAARLQFAERPHRRLSRDIGCPERCSMQLLTVQSSFEHQVIRPVTSTRLCLLSCLPEPSAGLTLFFSLSS